MEKRLTSGNHLAQQGILVIAPLQHGMEQKGEEVEAEQQRREVLRAMPKIVLQMVALGLEYVVVFLFDLPMLCCSLRWYSKNDGDGVKKMPKAPRAASWMVYWVFGPCLRWSGN